MHCRHCRHCDSHLWLVGWHAWLAVLGRTRQLVSRCGFGLLLLLLLLQNLQQCRAGAGVYVWHSPEKCGAQWPVIDLFLALTFFSRSFALSRGPLASGTAALSACCCAAGAAAGADEGFGRNRSRTDRVAAARAAAAAFCLACSWSSCSRAEGKKE